ncbi:hypothetical protein TYRP_019829 [Tyrophagus putrescentiae]|nr:hypothetical protein TYRP_019829 [Tyrophagus putrescentiae]
MYSDSEVTLRPVFGNRPLYAHHLQHSGSGGGGYGYSQHGYSHSHGGTFARQSSLQQQMSNVHRSYQQATGVGGAPGTDPSSLTGSPDMMMMMGGGGGGGEAIS